MLLPRRAARGLLARAMEHDSPSVLFRLACEHLRASQVVRPGVVTLSERVAAARAKAERETYDRLAHLLTDARCWPVTLRILHQSSSQGKNGSRDWAVPDAGVTYSWNWDNLKKLLA